MEPPLSITHPEQLLDLLAVHDFHLDLLEDVLGHAMPCPQEVTSPGAVAPDKAASTLEHWLNLLDLAITPPMIRDALKGSTTRESAEALLRHFVRKHSALEPDRDKTDFIITFLYRSIVPAERQVQYEFNVDEPSVFEEDIYHILNTDPVPLPEELRQLVREFPFIQQEVEDYGRFDQLMDSGVIQRARDIKQRFGESFYHPRVLATIATYNVYFRSRFDQLFWEAAEQIKRFAIVVQQQGASILSRVEGDVTVLHLIEVEKREGEIMENDYSRAQEQFRNISRLKKAVDSRTGTLPGRARSEPRSQAVHHRSTPPPDHDLPAGVTGAIEVSKLKTMEDTIRNFVMAADPRSANLVPLQAGNLPLSNPEVEAFRASHGSEKSFRAEYAGAVRQALAIIARIQAEQREFILKQRSAYLWRPHADAIAFLINTSQRLQEQCGTLLGMAEQRGLTEKVTALKSTLQKLRSQIQAAARALQDTGS